MKVFGPRSDQFRAELWDELSDIKVRLMGERRGIKANEEGAELKQEPRGRDMHMDVREFAEG